MVSWAFSFVKLMQIRAECWKRALNSALDLEDVKGGGGVEELLIPSPKATTPVSVYLHREDERRYGEGMATLHDATLLMIQEDMEECHP